MPAGVLAVVERMAKINPRRFDRARIDRERGLVRRVVPPARLRADEGVPSRTVVRDVEDRIRPAHENHLALVNAERPDALLRQGVAVRRPVPICPRTVPACVGAAVADAVRGRSPRSLGEHERTRTRLHQAGALRIKLLCQRQLVVDADDGRDRCGVVAGVRDDLRGRSRRRTRVVERAWADGERLAVQMRHVAHLKRTALHPHVRRVHVAVQHRRAAARRRVVDVEVAFRVHLHWPIDHHARARLGLDLDGTRTAAVGRRFVRPCLRIFRDETARERVRAAFGHDAGRVLEVGMLEVGRSRERIACAVAAVERDAPHRHARIDRHGCARARRREHRHRVTPVRRFAVPVAVRRPLAVVRRAGPCGAGRRGRRRDRHLHHAHSGRSRGVVAVRLRKRHRHFRQLRVGDELAQVDLRIERRRVVEDAIRAELRADRVARAAWTVERHRDGREDRHVVRDDQADVCPVGAEVEQHGLRAARRAEREVVDVHEDGRRAEPGALFDDEGLGARIREGVLKPDHHAVRRADGSGERAAAHLRTENRRSLPVEPEPAVVAGAVGVLQELVAHVDERRVLAAAHPVGEVELRARRAHVQLHLLGGVRAAERDSAVDAASMPRLQHAAAEVHRARPDVGRTRRAGVRQVQACERSAVQVQLLASRYGLVANREVAVGTPHLAAVYLEPPWRAAVGVVRIAHGDVAAADGSVVDHNLVRHANARARPLVADHQVGRKRQLATVDLQFRRTGLLPRHINAHGHVRGSDRATVERQLRPQHRTNRHRRRQAVVVADVDPVREFQQTIVHHEFAKGFRRARRLRRARRNVEKRGRLDRRRVRRVVCRAHHDPAVRDVQGSEAGGAAVAVRLRDVARAVRFPACRRLAELEGAVALQDQVARAALAHRARERGAGQDRHVIVKLQFAAMTRAAVDGEAAHRRRRSRVPERAGANHPVERRPDER